MRGRNEATGLGVFYGVREFLSYKEIQDQTGLTAGFEGKNIVIQGFGNVGYYAAEFMANAGAKITCVIEYNGALINPDGINVEEAKKHFTATGSFKNCPLGEYSADTGAVRTHQHICRETVVVYLYQFPSCYVVSFVHFLSLTLCVFFTPLLFHRVSLGT